MSTAGGGTAAQPAGEEAILARVQVLVPSPGGWSGLSYVSVGVFLRLIASLSRGHYLRRRARTLGLPLRRRMVWTVTDSRIALWPARRSRPGSAPLGEIPRSEILAVRRPTLGGKWRTVLLRLTNDRSLNVKVRGAAADQLAELLTPAPPAG